MAIILYEYAGGDRPEENKLSTVDPPMMEMHTNHALTSVEYSRKFGLDQRAAVAFALLRAGMANWGRMFRPDIEERIEE